MKYYVTYEETLARTVEVEADSIQDAEDKVWNMVETSELVLTADDYLNDSGCITFVDPA